MNMTKYELYLKSILIKGQKLKLKTVLKSTLQSTDRNVFNILFQEVFTLCVYLYLTNVEICYVFNVSIKIKRNINVKI